MVFRIVPARRRPSASVSSLGLVACAVSVCVMGSMYEERFAERTTYWRGQADAAALLASSYSTEGFSTPLTDQEKILAQHECFDPVGAPSFADVLAQLPVVKRGGLNARVPAVLLSFWYASGMLEGLVTDSGPSGSFYCRHPKSNCTVYVSPERKGLLYLDEFLFEGEKCYLAPSTELAVHEVYSTARRLGAPPSEAKAAVDEVWAKGR